MDTNPIKTKIDSLIEDLCSQTDAAKISAALQDYLATMSRFHNYSYCNCMLIAMQCPTATQVAGFHAWHKFNRYVRRGEHGIPILAPIIAKPKDGSEDQPRVVGFKTAYVFDVSQTDGDPLPEPPDWTSPEKHAELQTRLLALAASLDIKVTEAELEGAQGMSMGGKIILDPTAGTKTLVHEIAHELLHRKNRSATTPQRREVEAESIAYVVAAYFGLAPTGSANYLALWDADSKIIKQSLQVIQTTANQIINHISPTPKPEVTE